MLSDKERQRIAGSVAAFLTESIGEEVAWSLRHEWPMGDLDGTWSKEDAEAIERLTLERLARKRWEGSGASSD